MITNDLRNSILQIATEGKLVYNSDSKAQEDLDNILNDIKDEKKYKYEPITNGIFSIPDNWIWVRLNDVCIKITDGTHSTPKYKTTGIPFLSVKDVSSGVISFENTKFISEEEHKTLYSRCNPEIGDVLITKVGTTGVPAIVDTTKEFSLFVSVALLKINTSKIFNKYLYYFLQSPVVQNQVRENTRGIGNKNWVLDSIKNTLIPLPPLEEQHRIVEKLEELFNKLEEIKPLEQEINNLKASFTNKIKKSILIDAMNGGLSYSNGDDKPVNVSDIIKYVFLPKNWIRVKAKNILNITTGKKDANYGSEDGEYLFYTCANVPIKAPTYSFEGKNLILPGNGANVGLTIYSEDKFEAYQRTYVVNSKLSENEIYLKYIYYYFCAYWDTYNKDKMFGSAIPYIKLGNLENFEINLPPLEEQHRIVDKIEQLLPLCNDIEKLVNE